MALLGEDLKSLKGPLLYAPAASVGPWAGLGLAVILFFAYTVAQIVFAMLASAIIFGAEVTPQNMVQGAIIATLPASIAVFALAWILARAGGADASQVLALRWPRLSWLGWLALVVAFVVGMYLVIFLVIFVFGIDPAQYTPGPDGSSPETGSAGLVKEAMFALASQPRLYALAVLSVSLGAPIAEELVFRGQLFSSLSRTWFGKSGAVLISTVAWSLMHATEPWLSVGMIFVMGLVLGWLLLRFGSLYVTMICHGVWNALYSLIILGGAGP